MKTRFIAYAVVLFMLLTGIFYACTKQGSSANNIPANQQKVSLYLTDGPGFFDSVFIDINTVTVIVDTCQRDNIGPFGDDHGDDHHDGDHHGDDNFDTACSISDTLNFNAGVYNLAGLRNGIDTILASGNIPKGRVRRIIVTLGPNNYLVKNGVKYPLNTFSDTDTRIVIKLFGDEFQTSSSNINDLWLDFDVERSIIRLWDGKFYLRPVIRIFAEERTATISGDVIPQDAFPVISVFSGQDTLYALPNDDGRFMVRGLPTGTYSVFINSSNGYSDTTINHVNVTVGTNTDIGTIELHK